MSRFDYEQSKKIAAQDYTFYALIMAAMRQADSENVIRLQTMFPDTWDEFSRRWNAPGGVLEGEKQL